MTPALWEIMPQSVRNEQCNGTITAALNDSKTAATIGAGTPSTVCPSLTSLAKTPHGYCKKKFDSHQALTKTALFL